MGLNPFRAGRCLSTWWGWRRSWAFCVSIPFDQGNVFRPKWYIKHCGMVYVSQSLSNRAMSFNCWNVENSPIDIESQSLSNRAMSFNKSLYIRNCIMSQSLSNRAMSFDNILWRFTYVNSCLNPFRAGRCLSTLLYYGDLYVYQSLNPFRAGRCLSTLCWMVRRQRRPVSIPFEQGDVFRRKDFLNVYTINVSLNPFRAGRCLSTSGIRINMINVDGLNPFRAGRCLSTNTVGETMTWIERVSIPFEQGDVFRHISQQK